MIEWNEMHLQIREMMRRFVESEVKPNLEALEHGDMPPYEILRKMMKAFGILAKLRRLRGTVEIVGRHAIERRLHRELSALLFGLVEERQERVRANVQAVVLARQTTEVVDAGDVCLPTLFDQNRAAGITEAAVGVRAVGHADERLRVGEQRRSAAGRLDVVLDLVRCVGDV